MLAYARAENLLESLKFRESKNKGFQRTPRPSTKIQWFTRMFKNMRNYELKNLKDRISNLRVQAHEDLTIGI